MRHICSPLAVARHALAPIIGGLALIAASATAQAQGVATRDVELLATAGRNPVATIRKGAPIATGKASGAYVQSTVDGWIAAALLGGARDSFALTVKPGGAVRLRSSASAQAAVVADLRGGMGLNEVGRQGAWVHIRRTGWLPTNALSAPAAEPAPVSAGTLQATTTPGPVQGASAVPAAPAGPDTTRNGLVLTPAVQTAIAASPGGERLGSLGPGARATVTGRERGWVRVQVEGWVREADLSVADTALRGSLSAADLRADPDGTAGRLVHWEVEVLAHQVADPLRKGLADQEPYLLAQGPSGENALLYLAIPPALAATAREIPDLGRAIITARVRSGRSEPVGIPVLELLTIVGR
jgi:SH3-like domain-containing protein